jgi:hypothetical protein
MTLNLNYLSEFFMGAIDNTISEKNIRVLDRFFLRHCKICFESKAAREFYLKEYHQHPEFGDDKGGILMKSVVIHNGVFVPRILGAKPISYGELNSYVMHYPVSLTYQYPAEKFACNGRQFFLLCAERSNACL